MSKYPFKAIIVGGSVAGLTLAHTFEKAGINYVLLEARDTISPQLGASIVIMPNGARILDQLGVYEKLRRELMVGMKRCFTVRGDGDEGEKGKVVRWNEWPEIVEERYVMSHFHYFILVWAFCKCFLKAGFEKGLRG